MIQRAFRYRLYPTPEQEVALDQTAGVVRFVYNLAWEQRRDWWRPGRSFNFINQGREVTQLRREVDWIRAVSSTALVQALRDLDRAFINFAEGRASYPTPRCKGRNDSFRCKGNEIAVRKLNRKWATVHVPRIGKVKFRLSRPMAGRMINATFSREALGWHVSFGCEIDHEPTPSALPSVGIDRGVANTIALSTGEMLSVPNTVALERRRRKAQRVLARRVRGSNRYRKQRARLSRLAAKIARVRADWRHKATTDIAKRFGCAVMEDLNTVGMTARGHGKRGLNRSIREQGWRAFEVVLGYKIEERGGTLIKINPAYTSQECSACGAIDKASRESQSSYACRTCGFVDHADINAAKVILRRSTALMRDEDAGCGSDETRTVNHAIAA